MKSTIKILTSLGIIISVSLLGLIFSPQKGINGAEFKPATIEPSSIHFSDISSDNSSFSSIDKHIERFLNKWELKGASIAIAKDGKLQFAKGYGWADYENRIPVQPYNLFRVASVSKLITATAIMKLVDNNQLSLQDTIFGTNGILNDSIYLNYKDAKVTTITVENLLNHSGGWSNRWGDPVFMPSVVARKMNKELPVNEEDIIQFILQKRLHFNPGTMYSYSNLGYLILGKVIEKVSQTDYESFVKSTVLYPLGLFDMQIGGSYLEDRLELEVKYYEPHDSYFVTDFQNPNIKSQRCYGGNDIKTLSAAGGWVASSTDLLKLLLAIDGNKYPEDILSEKAVNLMTNPNNKNLGPLGWKATRGKDTWYRTGTLSGTSALMMKQEDGISYVIIFNTSTWKGPQLTTEIRSMMSKALNKVDNWSDYDLFDVESLNAQKETERKQIIF